MSGGNGSMMFFEDDHMGFREKTEVLEAILPVLDRDNAWSKAEDFLAFLNRDVLRHFKEEELLFKMVEQQAAFS